MPYKHLRDGEKKLAYSKPNNYPGKRDYEYFDVVKETPKLYTIKVENYEKVIGEMTFHYTGTIRVSKATGRELHPNSEQNSIVIHAYGRYLNEDGSSGPDWEN